MPLTNVTGRLVELLPDSTPSDEREQLLTLVRKGLAFSNPTGRPPGVLAKHIRAVVRESKPANFHVLLATLRLQARQTAVGLGPGVIVSVDRGAGKLTYRDGSTLRTVGLGHVKNLAKIRCKKVSD